MPESYPTVRPTKLEDCLELAGLMREEDRAEVMAAGGKSPLGALLDGYRCSKQRCWTVEYEGKPAAIFGAHPSPIDPKLGYIWLLGSPAISEFATTFLRQSKAWLEVASKDFDVVANYVDCRNDLHLKWLVFLGFELGQVVEQYGHEKRPFVRVTKIVTPTGAGVESDQDTPVPAR
jgi:hypothetical protein